MKIQAYCTPIEVDPVWSEQYQAWFKSYVTGPKTYRLGVGSRSVRIPRWLAFAIARPMRYRIVVKARVDAPTGIGINQFDGGARG